MRAATTAITTIWAVLVTVLLFTRPDISIALNNWIYQRETMEGHMFLARTDGPEGFVAFVNETSVYCGRPCVIEEVEGAQPSLFMCASQWEGRKHLCVARFWPGRWYLVRVPRQKSAERRE